MNGFEWWQRCEASFRISKPRQAFAVLNSVGTSPENADLAAFYALFLGYLVHGMLKSRSVQVHCAVGDVQKAWRKGAGGRELRRC